jgi:hypothetical protein
MSSYHKSPRKLLKRSGLVLCKKATIQRVLPKSPRRQEGTKKLSLLVVFLVACFGASRAQTTLDLTNSSGKATYDGSGIEVYANTSTKGWINLYTGPVASLLASGGTFSGTGAWFTYSVPNVSSATTQNVSRPLTKG